MLKSLNGVQISIVSTYSYILQRTGCDQAFTANLCQLTLSRPASRLCVGSITIHGRQRQLVAKNHVSRNALGRFVLAKRDAASQLDAARASLAQAHHARAYADLTAEHAGVLIEVSGEPGQVVEAVVRRARPVVLTALAAVLAFIPLTHDSFWGPLAYVLIGGVAAGTLITLLFVPALYALWYRLGNASVTD